MPMRYLKRRECALALVLLLLLTGGYWTYRRHRAKQNLARVEALSQEMAAARTRNLSTEQRQQLGKQMRTAVSQLTSQQRGQYFKGQRQKRTEDMKRILK